MRKVVQKRVVCNKLKTNIYLTKFRKNGNNVLSTFDKGMTAFVHVIISTSFLV
jgi:hypothetical protein